MESAPRPTHLLRRAALILAGAIGLALGIVPARAAAQVVMTPMAFDAQGRVSVLTPGLAERLHLSAPAWPVTGDFREARLYVDRATGAVTLIVERAGGVLEQRSLSVAERTALETAIVAAIASSGNPKGELGADMVSEPAGNALAKRELVLGLAVYGPLAASLASDGSTAGALYLITAGGTFFISYATAQSTGITRAQAYLAGNLGLAFGTAGLLAGYASSGNFDKGPRGIALASALAGTIVGANLGKPFTDAEAHSTWAGVEAGAGSAWGLATAAGASHRGTAAAVVAGEVVGGVLGANYPRHTRYVVTAGDVDATQTSGMIGAAFGATFLPKHAGTQRTGATLLAGYLGGLVIGDVGIARRFDLTESDATIMNVGAVAGGLIGLSIPVIAGGGQQAAFGAGSIGAAIGAATVIGLTNPRDEGAGGRRFGLLAPKDSRVTWSVAPALVGVLGRHPGEYSLLSLKL